MLTLSNKSRNGMICIYLIDNFPIPEKDNLFMTECETKCCIIALLLLNPDK